MHLEICKFRLSKLMSIKDAGEEKNRTREQRCEGIIQAKHASIQHSGGRGSLKVTMEGALLLDNLRKTYYIANGKRCGRCHIVEPITRAWSASRSPESLGCVEVGHCLYHP